MKIDAKKTYTAVMHTTMGDMTFMLLPKEAPMTVNNFVFLARDGYYNDVVFHRIVKGFMIQSGDPTGTGAGTPGYRFQDEPVTRQYVRGTLAMANAGPNTNGSQFFVIHKDYELKPNYTIFGYVTEGLDVLDKIASIPVIKNPTTGESSKPTQEVKITSIDITEK
jgi:cyclophilin family peptidyl-prolyl cis-trans isomerase